MRDGRSIEQMGQSSALTGIKTTGQGIKFTQGEELLPTRSAQKAVEPVLIVERRIGDDDRCGREEGVEPVAYLLGRAALFEQDLRLYSMDSGRFGRP